MVAMIPLGPHNKYKGIIDMQTRNSALDDLARVAAGALGVAAGVGKEAEELLKQRFAAILGQDGFVTREEFEAVKAMAVKARVENEALEARIAQMEASLSAPPATKGGATKRSPKQAAGAKWKRATPPRK
jgi:BMFP domain-containing protein YqiC